MCRKTSQKYAITYSLSLIGKTPVSKIGRCGFESQQIVPEFLFAQQVGGKERRSINEPFASGTFRSDPSGDSRLCG